MFLAILQHTPLWVFAVFAGLVWLGVRRMRTTDVPVRRLLIFPLAMAAFSLFGVVLAAGTGVEPLVAWALVYAGVVGGGALLPTRRDVQYSPATHSLRVPGSVLPLALMMTIFFVRYGVAVALAMRPDWRGDALFATSVAALYGLTSASFAGCALLAWRSAARPARSSSVAAAAA